RLDLALLVNREHQCPVRRIKVETDDVRYLLDELLVVRQFERLGQMGLEPMRRPDALYAGVAQTNRLGERAGAPLRGRRWLLSQRHLDHTRNDFGAQRLLPARPGRVAPKSIDTLLKITIAPAVGRLFGLAQRPYNRRQTR